MSVPRAGPVASRVRSSDCLSTLGFSSLEAVGVGTSGPTGLHPWPVRLGTCAPELVRFPLMTSVVPEWPLDLTGKAVVASSSKANAYLFTSCPFFQAFPSCFRSFRLVPSPGGVPLNPGAGRASVQYCPGASRWSTTHWAMVSFPEPPRSLEERDK